jgi:hypothetical protein
MNINNVKTAYIDITAWFVIVATNKNQQIMRRNKRCLIALNVKEKTILEP